MSAAAHAPQPSAAPYRLLVVDDSRAMQAIIRRVLESGGFGATDIRTVATGEDALAALEGFAPHLVISDWHMPRMSGIEMLQTLRQIGQTTLPVGFVTTETQEPLLAQAHSNGAAFVLQKPFRDEDLIRAVRGVLGAVAVAPPAAAPEPPPAASPPPADSGAVVREVRRLVQKHLPAAPFRVVDGEAFGLAHLSSQNLLALYVLKDSGAVCAIAAANIAAVCMLGSGDGAADPHIVRQAIHDGRASEEMVQRAVAFFRDAATVMPLQFGLGECACKGANLVPKEFAKLRSALEHARQRADYRLSIPGYGDGRFVFIRT